MSFRFKANLFDSCEASLSKFNTSFTIHNLSLNFTGCDSFFLDVTRIRVHYLASTASVFSIAANVAVNELYEQKYGEVAIFMAKNT